MYLAVSGRLWKENCKKLKQELDSALVNNECSYFDWFYFQKFVSPSTLASKNSVLFHAATCNAVENTRCNLKEEMVKSRVRTSLAKIFTLFMAFLFNLKFRLYLNFVVQAVINLTPQKSRNKVIHCRLHMSCTTEVDGVIQKKYPATFRSVKIRDNFSGFA